MRFLIVMNDRPGQWEALSNDEQEAVLDRHRAFREALEREGAFVDALHLSPPASATTILRDEAGECSESPGMTTDAEHLGGLYLIDVPDEAAAIRWARRGRFIPGTNVVRRVFED